MGFDLTNERIQDTYQQILQISGSEIVDGTGSVAPVTFASASHAAFAVTASFALNGGGGSATWPVSGTPSGIVSSSAQTIANLPSGTISGSSQVDYDSISNVPSGLLSSSAQIADDISGSFTSTSASIASDIETNKTDIATKLDTTTYTSNSSSVASRLTTNEGDITTQTSRVDSLVSATSSYAVKNSNNTFTGTQTFDNIAVNGTGSFAYIESVTGSAKIIGDAYIVLNNNTPTERYAGVKVFDSGSTNNSASFEFDGQTNDWFYEYTDDGGATEEFGVVMFGPGYNTRGAHVYPTNNAILKGTGDHHIVTSSMTDDGSKVTVTGNLRATNNIEGGNANSLSGNRRLVFGNSNNVTADDAINIGGESNSVNASYNFAVGTSGTTISSGDLSGVLGGYQHTLSGGARNVTIGGESVTNNQDYAIVLGRKSYTTVSPYTTYTANLDVSGSVVVSGSGITFSDGTTQTTAAGAAGLVSGTGADSMKSADDLTETVASAGGQYSIAIGDGADASGVGATAIGQYTEASNTFSLALGYDAESTAVHSIAIGDSRAQAQNAVAIGRNTSAQGNDAVGLGYAADARSAQSISIGRFSIVTATDGIAVGQEASVNNTYGIAIGYSSYGSGSGAISIGQSSEARGDNSVAIGSNIITTEDNEINIRSIFTYNSASNSEISLKSNVETTGQIYSPTHAGSVASSTSSIDFDNGNFATLNLTAATFLANPTNLKSGTTYTIIFEQSGSHVSGYGDAFLFAGGTEPTLSDGKDVLTMVSDGTNLYATALTDFS